MLNLKTLKIFILLYKIWTKVNVNKRKLSKQTKKGKIGENLNKM